MHVLIKQNKFPQRWFEDKLGIKESNTSTQCFEMAFI